MIYWNMYQILKYIKQQKSEMVVESVLQYPVYLSEQYRHTEDVCRYPEGKVGSFFGQGSEIRPFKGFGK